MIFFNNKKAIIITLSFAIFFSVYWLSNIIWEYTNSDAWLSNNDKWKLEWDYTFQSPDWNSLSEGDIVAKIQWQIISELFWDFSFWYGIDDEIKLIKDTSRTNCPTGPTYSISWTIKSYVAWWDMDFDSNSSYFCPYDWTWYWELYSTWLWTKIISNINPDLLAWAWFNLENKLLIKWVIWTNENWTNIEWNIINGPNDANSKILQISIPKSEIYKNLSKNIAILTKNIKAINKLTAPSNYWWMSSVKTIKNFSENIYYFDYKWESELTSSNENNKWKIVEIKNSNYDVGNLTNYQVEINWEKNLIIKWWNLYINADIYNKNTNSILVIVVERDSNNIKNWWNIYINPNVTNIDAVLIAEGSIINYNWDVTSEPDHLRNQLYIYWTTFTKNSIWTGKNPYWSDWYIEYPNDLTNWVDKYDLNKLRYFDLIISNTWTTDCPSNTNKLVPRDGSTLNKAKKFAWAWKRECLITDNILTNLRWTNWPNPVIIEYNPIILRKPPFILQSN
jgi:hypothetical protein